MSDSPHPLGDPPEGWRMVQLKDITSKIGSGATPTGGQAAYLSSRLNFVLVRSQNIFDRRFDPDGLAFISDEQAKGLRGVQLQSGDVLLNITGDGVTFGRAAKVPDAILPACVNQHVSIIRVDPTKADPDFVLSFLTHPEIKGYIESFNAGGSRRAITKAHIESFLLPLPPLNEQREIAEVLTTLDDKIELNRQMNRTLEETAGALYRSWFVDFDPVVAKAAGRAPAHLSPALATLFPAAFQDSELGPIPKGWQVSPVEPLLNRISVGKKFDQKTAFPFGKVPVLDQGRSGVIGYHDEAPGVIASIEEPVAVFANHTCYMRLITYPFSAIQNVLPFKGKEVSTSWLYYATESLQEFVEYKGHWPDLMVKKVVVAPVNLTFAFDEVVRPFRAMIHHNDQETQTLAALRDTLLPKLLSGEVRVREAARFASA